MIKDEININNLLIGIKTVNIYVNNILDEKYTIKKYNAIIQFFKNDIIIVENGSSIEYIKSLVHAYFNTDILIYKNSTYKKQNSTLNIYANK